MTMLVDIGQFVLVLLLAPLLNGLIKQFKARLQTRRGPGPLQPYRDLAKWARKESVQSVHASWVYRVAPLVTLGSVVAALAAVPVVWSGALLAGVADAVVVVGLLALGRFWQALAGLDTASNFGGMGSSREMTFAALVEPVLLLVLLATAVRAGTTQIALMGATLAAQGLGAVTPAHVLAAVALGVVVIAETGRVPVDNPDTHLELTMVHEGMLLEYSGRPLAALTYAALLKQALVLTLLANLFLPWTLAADAAPAALALGLVGYVAKVAAIGLGLGALESSYAKLRIFKVPDLVGAAFLLALLAVASTALLPTAGG